jgi:hypothetical protein
MKAIYAKDIKAMVKQFDLNEAESDYLNDIAEAINKERTDERYGFEHTLKEARKFAKSLPELYPIKK